MKVPYCSCTYRDIHPSQRHNKANLDLVPITQAQLAKCKVCVAYRKSKSEAYQILYEAEA